MKRKLLCKMGRHSFVQIAFVWHEWYKLAAETQLKHLFCLHCGVKP